MTEYLEKAALVRILRAKAEMGRLSECSVCFDNVAKMIEPLPAADVAEVKHGKWIEYPRAHYFKCSECKETVPYKKAVLIRGKRKYKYCPHCGAKMGAEG